MPKTTTVPLRTPIAGHGGPISQVVVKAPTLPQYMAIGEPFSAVPAPDGKTVVVENDAAIAAYAEVCIAEPQDRLLLAQVELVDAMAIKDAILDFFVEARQASRSPTSPTS